MKAFVTGSAGCIEGQSSTPNEKVDPDTIALNSLGVARIILLVKDGCKDTAKPKSTPTACVD